MLLRRIARPLLASTFIATGVAALRDPAPRREQAAHLLEQVPTPQQVPNDPDLIVRAHGAALLGGGILLATGRAPRLASTLLSASIIPATAIEHAFWEQQDRTKRDQARSLFLKNVSLLGGLLLAAADTEGRPGLAWRARHAAETTARETRRAAKLARREAKYAQKTTSREARLLAARARMS